MTTEKHDTVMGKMWGFLLCGWLRWGSQSETEKIRNLALRAFVEGHMLHQGKPMSSVPQWN